MPGRIARDDRAYGDIARYHSSRANDRIVPNRDTWQNNGSAADPNMAADANRPPELKPFASHQRIAGVVSAVDLNGWADLGAIAYGDFYHIKNDAVEIEEYA